MAEFTYEVTERIAVLSTNARGWERQLNMVSWNGNPPKYDIRDWSPFAMRLPSGDQSRMSYFGGLPFQLTMFSCRSQPRALVERTAMRSVTS